MGSGPSFPIHFEAHGQAIEMLPDFWIFFDKIGYSERSHTMHLVSVDEGYYCYVCFSFIASLTTFGFFCTFFARKACFLLHSYILEVLRSQLINLIKVVSTLELIE